MTCRPPLNRDGLLRFHADTCKHAWVLMSRKNVDYAEVEDIFGNLDTCEKVGLCTTESGILIRIFDKLSRITKLLKREAAVRDESLEDSAIDTINYLILLLAKRRTRLDAVEGGERKEPPCSAPTATEPTTALSTAEGTATAPS